MNTRDEYNEIAIEAAVRGLAIDDWIKGKLVTRADDLVLREELRVLKNKIALTTGVSDKIVEMLVDFELLKVWLREALDAWEGWSSDRAPGLRIRRIDELRGCLDAIEKGANS